MNKKILARISLFIIVVIFFTTNVSAQQVKYGTNNYVEYQVGTLPIVISVSHGGSLEPSSIPNRTCNNPVYDTDAFTIETALEIKNSLFTMTGCYPHLIISHLKRSKLDPNRNLVDGACANAQAATAWNEFHNFIVSAENTANNQYNNKSIFVDLHGHGNPIQRIELGYLLYDDELEMADNTLNTTQYINNSSIKKLVLNNINNYTHVQLLRGEKSFGTLLSNNNFPSVPSQNIPFPGTTTNYFSGGYNIANHTSYKSGVNTNGFQMELNYNNIRDTPANRILFSNAFAQAIIEYLNTHFSVNLNNCSTLSVNDFSLNTFAEFYPNPVKKGALIYFNALEKNVYDYKIVNIVGQEVKHGQLSSEQSKINTETLNKGIYVIQLFDTQKNNVIIKKIIIQ